MIPFKYIRIGYLVTFTLGSALTMIIYLCGHFPGLFISILSIILWFVFCMILFFIILLSKSVNKIHEKRNNCDIKAYVEALEEYYNTSKYNQYAIDLAAGYSNLGEYRKAIDILLRLELKPSKISHKIHNCAVYYGNLCYSYIGLKDIEKAKKALAYMKVSTKNPRLSEYVRAKLFKTYERMSILLSMEQGNFAGAEKHFLTSLEVSNTILDKVICNWNLAGIYLHDNKIEKAKECLRFVSENGGDTIYAVDAKKKLTELNVDQA